MTARGAGRRGANVYVLALIEPGSRVPDRLGRRRLETIEIDGIVAVVERRRAAPAVSERALRDQHRAIVQLHEMVGAILPARFGALTDVAELARVVRLRRAVIAKALGRVRGRDQFTIRVFGQAVAVAPAQAARTGTAYLAARARAARPVVPAAANAVRRAVRPLVEAETIEAGAGNVRLVINHLVRRENGALYQAKVNRVLEARVDSDAIVVSGPWPPFAFAPNVAGGVE